jgi:lysyl-tRNA synthetase class 1
LLAQVPGVDIAERVRDEKGRDLDAAERLILEERLRSARAWLETYAPESAKLAVVRDRLPELVSELTPQMRRFLDVLATRASASWPGTGEAWQSLIFQVAGELEMRTNRQSFAAIYAAFLGRENGPRAGWLLAGLDPAFVVTRLREAAQVPAVVPG